MPAPTPATNPISPRSRSLGAALWLVPIAIVALGGLWIWAMTTWSYSSGERAGWVQKFSRKGWICKTWEGELALVTMPGTAQEKFYFTVWDEDVASKVNAAMGKRVSLHYDEKVGLPGSCFGETRHWVNGVKAVEEIPLAPGIVVPVQPAPAQSTAPTQPAPVQPAPAAAPAQPAPPQSLAPAAPAQPAPVQPAAPAAPGPSGAMPPAPSVPGPAAGAPATR
jgi:hypothetical protein